MMLARLDPQDATLAAEVLPAEWLEEDAFRGLGATQNVRAWVGGLLAAGHVGEALRVIVRVLPRNYVVAWGCERLRDHLARAGAAAPDADRIGLALAERCLRNPGTDACDAALEFAERERFRSAGAWLAAAAGWLEAGLAPRSSGVTVPAPDFLPGDAVGAALVFAANDPATREQLLRGSVEHALRTFGGSGGDS